MSAFRHKINNLLVLSIIFCIFAVCLAGCQGSDSSDSDTGGVSFQLQLEDVPNTNAKAEDSILSASIDCSATGIASIECNVYESNGSRLSGKSFTCSAHQGVVDGMAPGSGRRAVFEAKNNQGNNLYEAEVKNVTINPGQITPLGQVTLAYVGDKNDSDDDGDGYTENEGDCNDNDKNINPGEPEICGDGIDQDCSGSDEACNQLPTATITSPADDSTYTSGKTVTFTGIGVDPEDGYVLGSTFVWTSSRDGQIKTGQKSFSTSSLSVGTHSINLTITDKNGASDSASINVIISSTSSGNTYNNTIGMDFVYIKPGTFMMGSPEDESGRDDDETLHQVTLTQGFYMQTTEVTHVQWESVMATNPSLFSSCGDDCPVEQVSWNDAQSFIAELNRREDTNAYRLPTEAEWEYSCRAGSETAYFYGDSSSSLGSYAWYDNNSGNATHPVGQKQANTWGLYDMHGNVWEWCSDWYGSYSSSAVTNPEGPTSGTRRVSRGGGFYYATNYHRSANRSSGELDLHSRNEGFRVVRGVDSLATDKDGDGYNSDVDCNDNDNNINPGEPEICGDGIDQDCDGADEPCSGDGLIAYYPFNGNANDESGNGNDGTEYGGVNYTSGKIGQAATFDGVNDYIQVNNSNSLNISKFTTLCWVKVYGSATKQSIFDKRNGEAKHNYNLWYINDNFEIVIGDGHLYKISESPSNQSVFNHIAATYDQRFLTLYINGVQVNQTNLATSENIGNGDLVIGCHGLIKYYFKGDIDEMRIYNRVLSESEIQQFYNENN